MKFQDSELPNNALVRRAFEHSLEDVMTHKEMQVETFKERMEQLRDQSLRSLEEAKKNKAISQNDYETGKEEINNIHDVRLSKADQIITNALRLIFKKDRLGKALEIANNSDGSKAPEILAAALLLDVVKTPMDYKNVEAKFGATVGALIAEVQQAVAHPETRQKSLATASRDAKRLLAASFITDVNNIIEQIKTVQKKLPKGMSVDTELPEDLNKDAMVIVRAVSGCDDKLEKRLIDVFNDLNTMAGEPFRIEKGADGKPSLVKDTSKKAPPGNKPPIPPKGPISGGSIGDDF